MNNLGEAFTYAFSDRDWPVKFAVGALFLLLCLLLVGIPFVAGYFVELIRRVARNELPYLPDWSNLGRIFGRGLVYLVIALIYTLPLTLLGCCLFGTTLLLSGSADGEAGRATFGTLVGTLAACLGLPVGLLYAAIMPVVTVQYAVRDEFGAAFRFGEMWELVRANLGNYLIVVLIAWAVSHLIAPLGVIACGVGVLATGFYALVVTGYLYGLFYRASRLPPPEPPAPAAPLPTV